MRNMRICPVVGQIRDDIVTSRLFMSNRLWSAFLCSGITVALFFYGCASQKIVTTVTYTTQNENETRTFNRGSVLWLPVFLPRGTGGMADTNYLCFSKQKRALEQSLGVDSFIIFTGWWKRVLEHGMEQQAAEFIDDAYRGAMVKLKSSDSVWNTIHADYMVVTRLREGKNIRNTGRVRMYAVIETELWQVKNREVVHRIKVKNEENAQYDDFNSLICDMTIASYNGLPALDARTHRKNWLFFLFFSGFSFFL